MRASASARLRFKYAYSPETLKALVDWLRFDPFYVAISENVGDEVSH